MRQLAVLLLLGLCACVTQLSHPTKSEAEMQVDIDRCVDEAVAGRPVKGVALDPLGELDDAYDCLEKLGYTKGQTQKATVAAHGARIVPTTRPVPGQTPAAPPKGKPAAQPCRIPCAKQPN